MKKYYFSLCVAVIVALLSLNIFAAEVPTEWNDFILNTPEKISKSIIPPPNDKSIASDGGYRDYGMIIAMENKDWLGGCAPTVVAMIAQKELEVACSEIGASKECGDEIVPASSEHYADYSLPIDKKGNLLEDCSVTPGKCHESNSLADYFATSFFSKGVHYGATKMEELKKNLPLSFEKESGGWIKKSWVNQRVLEFYKAGNKGVLERENMFKALKYSIDRGDPVFALVSTPYGPHAVAVIGYRSYFSQGKIVLEYACYDTWYDEIRWSRVDGYYETSDFGVFLWLFIHVNIPPSQDKVKAAMASIRILLLH